MKDCTRESTQCFGYVFSSLHQESVAIAFRRMTSCFRQVPTMQVSFACNVNHTCDCCRSRLRSCHLGRCIHSHWVTFPGRCIETELCWCEKVLTCHTSKRLKPLLGITSRFLRRHRSLGIVESLDQSPFCHQVKRFPSLDSSAQSTALPRQVSMPKGFLYLSVPEHCNSMLT